MKPTLREAEPEDLPDAFGTSPGDRVPLPVKWATLGFVATAVALVAFGSMLSPDIEPGYAITPSAVPANDGSWLLTVDVKDRHAWVSVDLGQGKVVAQGAPADLLIRRYTFRAPQGAARLEGAGLPADLQLEQDILVDGDLRSPALDRWYEYGLQSHLLTPKDQHYALKTTTGSIAILQVVGYYCQPEGSGCMTLRYRLHGPESSGSR